MKNIDKIFDCFINNSGDLHQRLKNIILEDKTQENVKWTMSRKEFYSILEYVAALRYLYFTKYIEDSKLSILLNIVEYYGDRIAFSYILKSFDLNTADNFGLLMNLAKCYKNFGYFNEADNTYVKLGMLAKSTQKLTYFLVLYAKFTNDYFLRDGIYSGFIEIAFNRLEYSSDKLSQKNIDIITHSMFKIDSDNVNVLKTHSEIDLKKPNRITFSILKKKALELKNLDTIISNFEYLVSVLSRNGNYKAYYVRALELLEIKIKTKHKSLSSFKKHELQGFKSSILNYTKRYKDIKLYNRTQKVLSSLYIFLSLKIEHNEFQESIKEIISINNIPNKHLQKPNDLLKTLTNFRYLSITNSYIDIAKEIEQIITIQLQILHKELSNDFNILYENQNKRDNSLSFVLTLLENDEEQNIIKNAINLDLLNLGTRYFESMDRLTSLNRWNLGIDKLNILNDLIRFNNHDFAYHINQIQKEALKINNKSIIQHCENLHVILANSFNRKFYFYKKGINLHEQISSIIVEIEQIFPNRIEIINKVELNLSIVTLDALVYFVTMNLLKNICEISNNFNYKIQVKIDTFVDKDCLYLSINDNIIENKNIENILVDQKYNDEINTNNSKGHGLKFIKEIVGRICKCNNVRYEKNLDGKTIYVPITLKHES